MAVALLLTAAPAAFAQSIFANLSGTVIDSSGAAVPGAGVDVQNSETKVVRHYLSNDSGFFSATDLPTGTYNITAEAKGFQKWVGSGIVLNSGDDKTLNIPLKVGSENVTVEVDADSSAVAITDTGAKIDRIDTKDLENLALVGRDAYEVVKILPGAAQVTAGGTNRANYTGEMVGINGSIGGPVGGLSGVSINGQTGMGISLNQDGQNVEDPGAVGGGNTPVNPNPDMIGEMTIQTSNYAADNVKGPIVINAVTRQGSSNYHGNFRFNARNSALNSEESFSKFNESQPGNGEAPGELKFPSHNYYPGFNIGGPILIPHTDFNRSRTKYQFFESYEYYNQLIAAGTLDRDFIPTTAMLGGDFSAMTGWANAPAHSGAFNLPTAPAVGSSAGFDIRRAQGCTISGGVLSPQCISPMGQQLLKLAIPSTTTPGGAPNSFGFNYINGLSAGQNSYQNVVRGDLNFTDNTKAYLSWSHQSEGASQPDGIWFGTGDWDIPVPGGEISQNRSDLYTANFLHMFSPTLTVEARFGYTHMDMPGDPANPKQVLRSGLNFPQKGVFGSPMAPRISNGWDYGGGIPNLGDWFTYYHPTYYAEKYIPSSAADVTKVFRTHTIKTGFFWEKLSNAQDANGMQFGGDYSYPSWAGTATGNIYADILMGIIDNGKYNEQAFPPTYPTVESIYSSYVTDHWKINRRITVDYGSRFDHYAPTRPNDPWGNAVWNPSQYQAGVQNSGVTWNSLDSSVSKAGVSADLIKFSPRFGASIDVFGTGKTVIRGGWGIFLSQNPVLSQGGPAGVPEGSVTWSCGGTADCGVWEQVDNHIPNSSGTCVAGTNCAPLVTASSFTGHPVLTNSSINVVDPRNKDNPQTTNYSLNIDQQLPKKLLLELSYVGSNSEYLQNSVNLNSVPLGAMLNTTALQAQCPNDFTSTTNTFAQNVSNAQGDSTCQQTFRPFKNYQGINALESSKKAQYDAFQVSLRRSAGWATVSLNYSFAKAFTNSSYEGAFKDYGVHEYWSVDPNNRLHVLNAAYYFTIPKLASSSRLVRGLTNGWELSGITQVESGAQLVTASNSSFNLSGALGAPQLVGTPDISVAPVITCNPAQGRLRGQFINPNCFALPTGTNYGDGRLPYLAGPMYWNSDISVIKRFNVKEKQSLEIRASAFNFMNHALPSFNGGDPNLKLNFNGSGVLSNGNGSSAAKGFACPGSFCQDFGYADYTFGHRDLEFGAKYTF